jgi:hypothetical protein
VTAQRCAASGTGQVGAATASALHAGDVGVFCGVERLRVAGGVERGSRHRRADLGRVVPSCSEAADCVPLAQMPREEPGSVFTGE